MLLAFPGGTAGKILSSNIGDMSSILGFGRSPGEGNGISHLSRAQPGPLAISLGRPASGRCGDSGMEEDWEKRCQCISVIPGDNNHLGPERLQV